MTEMRETPEPVTFQTFTSAPDRDGDHVRIAARDSGLGYAVRVYNRDGDFQTAWVTREDMIALARGVLDAEDGA